MLYGVGSRLSKVIPFQRSYVLSLRYYCPWNHRDDSRSLFSWMKHTVMFLSSLCLSFSLHLSFLRTSLVTSSLLNIIGQRTTVPFYDNFKCLKFFCSTLEHTKYGLWKISQNRTVAFVYFKLEKKNHFFESLFFPFLSLVGTDMHHRNIHILNLLNLYFFRDFYTLTMQTNPWKYI